jgi:hypothetical protein
MVEGAEWPVAGGFELTMLVGSAFRRPLVGGVPAVGGGEYSTTDEIGFG